MKLYNFKSSQKISKFEILCNKLIKMIKPNIKRYHITGPLKETARNHTPTPGLTHQRGRPEHAL